MNVARIQPLPNRILVKTLSRYGDIEDKLKLVVVDGKKHYQGTRRGEILAIGNGIRDLKVGDVVWFVGAQGKTFDQNTAGFNDGVGMRILRMKDILCVEEEIPKGQAAEGVAA